MARAPVDFFRPKPGSAADQRIQFVAAALTILTSSLALAGITWHFASTDDGRIKALLWWCFGVTAFGAYIVWQLSRREHRETRIARASEGLHDAHHKLRDAAYQRYIALAPESIWKPLVEDSLRSFADAFSVAAGARCHASIKKVGDPTGPGGRASARAEELLVEDYSRSSGRPPRPRTGVPNTVGRNTDFRALFSPDGDNRCWYHDDLLQLGPGLYDNPHWPDDPSRRNVPYRTTMVWPVRKVIQEGSSHSDREVYIHGFLTVDSKQPHTFEYERHFDLGAAYADHLLSVLWDPVELRRVHHAIHSPTPAATQVGSPGSEPHDPD